MTLTSVQWFTLSLAIGLLIGIERERHHPEGSQAIGVRTFALLAVLGTFVSVMKNEVLTATISAFVLLGILLGYVRTTYWQPDSKKIGLTTEVSAAIVFCLGYMTPIKPLLAVVVGGGVLLMLIERRRIHTFSREILTRQEIESAVVLLVFILGVLPFIPDKTLDPWQLINLHYIGTLMALIAAIQFIGYVMLRFFGKRLGVLLLGFFGGLVSSTAVFVNVANMVKRNRYLTRPGAASAVLAFTGKLVELAGLLFVASLALFHQLMPVLALMIIAGFIVVALIVYRAPSNGELGKVSNPLDIRAILWLTAFIAGVFTVVAIIRQHVGVEGVQFVTFLGAMFELHGSALAVAMLFTSGQLTLIQASSTLAVGICGSLIAKIGLLWGLSRSYFALWATLGLTIMLAVGAVAFWAVEPWFG